MNDEGQVGTLRGCWASSNISNVVAFGQYRTCLSVEESPTAEQYAAMNAAMTNKEFEFDATTGAIVPKKPSTSLPDIEKTEEDVVRIKDTVLSATTLQNYLACPAKFYYGTVKGLEVEEEVAEALDYGMFGTIFHETMRSLYTGEEAMDVDFFFDPKSYNHGLTGEPLKMVTREYIKSWLSRDEQIRAKGKALIMKEMNVLEISGRNLVVADVIVKYVRKTLSCDLEVLRENDAPHFVMHGLENRVARTIFGQKFKGYIDRLDSVKDGEIRVVDYKTGKSYCDNS